MISPRHALARQLMFPLIVATLGVQGCVSHPSTVKDRFASEYRCHDVHVQNIGGTTYVASGCGARATYTCATNRTSQYSANSVCIRESETPRRPHPRAAAVAPAPAPSTTGSVERKFDEARKLHVVKAWFKPAASGIAAAEAALVGAPEHELSTVYVNLSVRGGSRKVRECKVLRVLINGQPFAGTDVTVESDGWITRAAGRFDFQVFKPLARKHAELGLDLCDQRFAFTEPQMPNVIKFFEIFSQLAMDAQAQQNAAPAGEPSEVPKDETAPLHL